MAKSHFSNLLYKRKCIRLSKPHLTTKRPSSRQHAESMVKSYIKNATLKKKKRKKATDQKA